MLKRLLSWFKKDYAKASAKVLSAFDKIKADLEKLNDSISEKKADNLSKISELQDHNTVLETTASKNAKVMANLSTLMGEEPTKSTSVK